MSHVAQSYEKHAACSPSFSKETLNTVAKAALCY